MPTTPILLPLLSVLAGSVTASTQNTSPDEQAIVGVLEKFADGWNRHDAKAFSMVFAEDADFTNVVGRSAHGRSLVEQFHAPVFATIFKESHQTITSVAVRFVKPDIAAVDAGWEMTGVKDPEGKLRPSRKGLLNFIFAKTSGRWEILVMHNMDLPG